jgi:chemotaxis signal transduction protein
MAIARLIARAHGEFAALPPHTTLEIVEHPKAEPVPGGAAHALGLMPWQGQRLPLIDLDRLAGQPASTPAVARYALVVAYQIAPGQPVRHGALALHELPQTVQVADADCCALPAEGAALWSRAALSCFRHAGRAVPVLDTARLFGASHALPD